MVFADALFRTGALLENGSMAEMIETDDGGYGLGVEHFSNAVGHRGTFFGSQTAVAYDPATDAIVVVLANAFDFAGYDAGPFTRFLNATLAGQEGQS